MMACEYCRGEKPIIETRAVEVFIKDGTIHIKHYVLVAQKEEAEPINYCPMCGEKLGE